MKQSSKKDIQFMKLCFEASKIFSTCGKKQYAALLVDDMNHIVGFGYNGGPRNTVHCKDGGCKRFLENSQSGSVYDNCIAIHAEANALLHSDYNSKPTKLYVNGPPCFNCAKLICNSTLKTVYYSEDSDYKNWEEVKSFINNANIETIKVDTSASI